MAATVFNDAQIDPTSQSIQNNKWSVLRFGRLGRSSPSAKAGGVFCQFVKRTDDTDRQFLQKNKHKAKQKLKRWRNVEKRHYICSVQGISCVIGIENI